MKRIRRRPDFPIASVNPHIKGKAGEWSASLGGAYAWLRVAGSPAKCGARPFLSIFLIHLTD